MAKTATISLSNVIQVNYPTGFLEQLGKAAGQVVGLGEYLVVEAPGDAVLSFPVRSRDNIFGELKMLVERDGDVANFSYRGAHPLLNNGDISFQYTRECNAELFSRADSRHQIVFPGKDILELPPTLVPETWRNVYISRN